MLTKKAGRDVVDKRHGAVEELADVLGHRRLGKDVCCAEAAVAIPCQLSSPALAVVFAYLREKSIASSILVTA